MAYKPGNGPLARPTASSIEYRKRSFHSALLHLISLAKRMSNVIHLTDSGVMKADSAVLKNDSRAMKFIAFLTLVFMPATGVASVFSTPFFNIDWESLPEKGEKVLRTAESFWIFWAVVLPLTAVGLLLLYVWTKIPRNLIKTWIVNPSKYYWREVVVKRRRGKFRVDMEMGLTKAM